MNLEPERRFFLTFVTLHLFFIVVVFWATQAPFEWRLTSALERLILQGRLVMVLFVLETARRHGTAQVRQPGKQTNQLIARTQLSVMLPFRLRPGTAPIRRVPIEVQRMVSQEFQRIRRTAAETCRLLAERPGELAPPNIARGDHRPATAEERWRCASAW
jgi:hypothetical protein